MRFQLKPNANSLGKTGEPEAIDICDGGSIWASVHIDAFWQGRHVEGDVYWCLRKGETVEVELTAVPVEKAEADDA